MMQQIQGDDNDIIFRKTRIPDMLSAKRMLSVTASTFTFPVASALCISV